MRISTWLALCVCLIIGLPHLADRPLLGFGPSKSLELVQTIPLKGKAGRFDHLALDAKGARLFVANLSNNSLDIVDLREARLVKQIPGQGKIQGVAYVPDLDRIFVANGEDGVCNVFDGRDYSLLKSFKLPDADNVRYDPKLKRIYVAHAENALAVIDAKALKLEAAIKLPGPTEGFQIDPAGSHIFLNCTSPSQVTVVATKKREVTGAFLLQRAKANYPLALDAENSRIFVGCRQPPIVLALDAQTGKELSRVDIPGDIDDLFHDAKRKRLYAICGEGFVAVIEQRGTVRFEVVERLATAKLARTGLFEPQTGRLYVVLPAHDGKGPSLEIYQAKP